MHMALILSQFIVTHIILIVTSQFININFAPKATPSPPPPVASDSKDEDDDDASDDDDGDASSTDEMSTWHSYPLSLVTKRGSSFGYESSHS